MYLAGIQLIHFILLGLSTRCVSGSPIRSFGNNGRKITRVILTFYFNPGKYKALIQSESSAMTVSTVQTPVAIAFSGAQKIASGSLFDVALASKSLLERDANAQLLVLEYLSARVIELDLRGSRAQVAERISAASTHEVGVVETSETSEASESRGRGRPKLGVMAREVTLLPRHWSWLAEQPGGASVTLRKLVEQARHAGVNKDLLRAAQESAYRFMSSVAGDFPGFEEATRALFAPNPQRFATLVAPWAKDVRAHALLLANRAFEAAMPALKPITANSKDASTCAI